MTIQKILQIFLGVLLVAIGISLNIFSFMAIYSLEKAIYYANISLLNGESILSYIKPIAGLLSGGHIKIMDSKYIYSFIIIGWGFIWMGSQVALFALSGTPLKVIFRKKYWTVMDIEILHRRKYK